MNLEWSRRSGSKDKWRIKSAMHISEHDSLAQSNRQLFISKYYYSQRMQNIELRGARTGSRAKGTIAQWRN